MQTDSFGRQLFAALARTTPAFQPSARPARLGFSRQVLDALARITPAFQADPRTVEPPQNADPAREPKIDANQRHELRQSLTPPQPSSPEGRDPSTVQGNAQAVEPPLPESPATGLEVALNLSSESPHDVTPPQHLSASEGEAPTVTQAVILTRGRMSRLRPYDSRSSALVEIPGTGAPIIAHQLAWLKSEGVTDVVISSAYHPALMEWVEGADLSLNVMVLAETDELGRGGELKHAASALPRRDEPWIAIHGDTWMRFSVRDMAVFHQEKLAVATMALVRPRIPWSTVETDSSGYVVELNDARYSPYLINAGVYVFAANFADLLPEVGDHERTIFPLLARERRLAGFRLPPSSYWQTLEGDKVAAEAAARTEDQRS